MKKQRVKLKDELYHCCWPSAPAKTRRLADPSAPGFAAFARSASGRMAGCTHCSPGASRAITFLFRLHRRFLALFRLYLQSLSFSAWDIGLLMSQMQLMHAFGPNLWGWLADRFRRRVVIVRLAGAAWADSPLFLARALPGMLVAMAILAFSGVPRCRWSKP